MKTPNKVLNISIAVISSFICICIIAIVAINFPSDQLSATVPLASSPLPLDQIIAQTASAAQTQTQIAMPPTSINSPTPINTLVAYTPTPELDSSPIEQIKYQFLLTIGDSNRKISRINKVAWHVESRVFSVDWSLNDILTNDMIYRSAQIDIADMLKIISQPNFPYDYQEIVFTATYSLVDIYGNASEDQVILAVYQKDIVNKINWGNFLTKDIFLIAKKVYIHPVFGIGVCSCDVNTYNCSFFSFQSVAQQCFDYCISQGVGDVHQLDDNHDNLACENLP